MVVKSADWINRILVKISFLIPWDANKVGQVRILEISSDCSKTLCCQQSSYIVLVCLTNRFNCLILCPIYHFHDVCIPICFHQTHRSPLNIRTSEGVRVVNLKTWTVRRRLQEWCWPKTELTSSTSICINWTVDQLNRELSQILS